MTRTIKASYHHSIFLFCFLIITMPNALQAQTKTIEGVVASETDSLGLEFAHVYVKNSSIGTYTNFYGEFSFHYPDSSTLDTIVISRVGYSNFSFAMEAEDTITHLSILMKESKNQLAEVVIYSQKDTVAAIVKKVLKRFRKNYPTKLHYLDGFYREVSLKGEHYTRLIEASIGITENSYRKSETTSKVKIRQIRKSEDYRDYSFKLKLYEATMKKVMKISYGKLYAHHNNIYRLLLNNMVRSNHSIFTGKKKNVNDFLNKYDFEISKVTRENDILYYHITYHEPVETSAHSYISGSLVINMDDYAIIEHSSGVVSHPYKTFPNQHLYYEGNRWTKNHTIYSKIEGKYYPTYFELFEPSMGGTVLLEDEKTGEKKTQFNKITFMVNEVVTRKRDFDRVKKREALEDDIDLYDIDQPYDSAFWANYNILLLDPLLKPAIEDLEKEKTLEEQFQQDGK